jgi:hypothetical protein
MPQVKLKNLAAVHAGHPIRGRVENIEAGELALVQLKNVDPILGFKPEEALARIHPVGKKAPDLLRPDDILFVNRGKRLFSVLVSPSLGAAVAAPHFFVIRTKGGKVLPAYLAWYLNHRRAQHYFSQHAAGSALPHVTSAALRELPVALPNLKTQKLVAAAHDSALEERRILEELIRQREKWMTEVLDRVIDHGVSQGV